MQYIVKLIWLPVLALIYISVLNTISSSEGFNLPIRSYIIKSGSMEPVVMTGDLILINTQLFQIQRGDIVTFKDPKDRIVTHRISKIIDASGTIQIFTKGDNNQTADPFVIRPDQIIGSYLYRVPKLGFLLVYFSQPEGSITLVLVVLALIFVPELMKDKKIVKLK
ncbi:MAG: signal peptidase I [Patescibacteria group bacterium]|nr:signal peptidase I [Patescibacteria group bacterium]